LLHRIVELYANVNPPQIAAERIADADSDFDHLHFAYFGTPQAGQSRQYRVQGTTLLIEFSNSQPDPLGNPSNHIHSTFRNLKGDFGTPNLVYPSSASH